MTNPTATETVAKLDWSTERLVSEFDLNEIQISVAYQLEVDPENWEAIAKGKAEVETQVVAEFATARKFTHNVFVNRKGEVRGAVVFTAGIKR